MNISFIISKIEANYTLVILVSTLIRRLKWEVKRSKKWGKYHKFDNDTHTQEHIIPLCFRSESTSSLIFKSVFKCCQHLSDELLKTFTGEHTHTNIHTHQNPNETLKSPAFKLCVTVDPGAHRALVFLMCATNC